MPHSQLGPTVTHLARKRWLVSRTVAGNNVSIDLLLAVTVSS